MVFLFFVLGLSVGSFLNVLIYRIGTSEKITLSRSHCPLCGRTLAAIDLVPIVSFVFLAGRCRFCRGRISWQYPLVELITGLFFVIAWREFFSFPVDLIAWLFFLASFVVISTYDIKFQRIPDLIVWPLLVGALAYSIAPWQREVIQAKFIAGVGTAACILLIVLITKERGMGMGDVPIAFLQGLLLGYPDGFIALGLSFILGAAFSAALLMVNKATLKTAVPFTPFLILGLLIVRFFTFSLLSSL